MSVCSLSSLHYDLLLHLSHETTCPCCIPSFLRRAVSCSRVAQSVTLPPPPPLLLPCLCFSDPQYKLCRVRHQKIGDRGVPYIATNDGRTIRYPDPLIKVNDTVKIELETGKVVEHIKFDVGNICMVTGEGCSLALSSDRRSLTATLSQCGGWCLCTWWMLLSRSRRHASEFDEFLLWRVCILLVTLKWELM